MIRDRGPINNLGYGITSRDLPYNEGETEGVSRDSGVLSRALDGHPVMRFFAHTAGSIAVAGVLTAGLKKGGLKLAQKMQGSLNTTTIRDITQIRKHLDELQGVKRSIDGVEDPYSSLVFRDQDSGELTTGYLGKRSELHRYSYVTSDELELAGRGLTSEPPAIWTLKDEIQKRMIRAGRRMPYELPALYASQRVVSDQLFGEGENRKKVNWYNPADVVSDFVKTSLTNIATMSLPFEIGGAGVAATKSSMNTFKYSMHSLRELSPVKQKATKGFVDLTELLSEVGHDLSTISNRFLRTAAQTSGALNAASEALKEQPRIVDSLHKARHGLEEARRRSIANGSSKLGQAGNMAKGFMFGIDDGYGALDAIPAFRGATQALRKGAAEFKLFGKGYDALQSSVQYNKILTQGITSSNDLHRAMNVIQAQYSSRLSRLAGSVATLGAGGPGDKSFNGSEFYIGQQSHEYKKLVAKKLQKRGLSEKESLDFASQLKISNLKKGTDPTNIISIGRNRIHGDADNYYDQIVQRYQGVKGGKEFFEKVQQLSNSSSPGKFMEDVISDVNADFFSREFQLGLKSKIANQWNQFYRNDLTDIAASYIKPQKAAFQDYVGPLTEHKQQFLQRKAAQSLGIKLKDANGKIVSDDIVKTGLAKRGYDPNNFVDLRSFLVDQRKMTAGIFNGGYNLFGLQPMLIDEAVSTGRYNRHSPLEQKIIGDLAGSMARNDPVSRSIGFNRLDGVYKTKSGQVLDFSAIKKTFAGVADFFASEFQIPIVKLNVADLFGYKSFSDMARRGPLQYSPGMSVQPFGELAKSRSDFHMWHSTGGFLGTKGKLTSYSTDSMSGAVYGKTLNGTYRAVPTNSTEMYSRHARYAANLTGEAAYNVRGTTSGSTFLDRVFNNASVARGFKSRMAIDAEQPNSIFGLVSRFTKRNRDINNPRVLGKLISGEEVRVKRGDSYSTMKLDFSGNGPRVVDGAGKVVDGIDEASILRSYDAVRRQSFKSGFSNQFMKELEEAAPDLFKFMGGRGISEIRSPQEILGFLENVESSLPGIKNILTSRGLDPAILERSYSRIRALKAESDLLARSNLTGRSPSINSRLDELRSETFRFISQTNALMSGNKDEMFINMQSILQNMKKTVPPGDFAEAQAAVLSTLFNMSAYSTFRQGIPNIENARAAAKSLFEQGTSPQTSEAIKKIFEPFTKGTFDMMSSGARRPLNRLIPLKERMFGTAPYMLDDLSIDPLGSGQRTTFVPTFGTVFGANPMAAIKSALGINTYVNPEGFSGASIPMSQGVERLNKYFGSLGMQLDVSKFKGPLDLYTRGMVGKRVLPLYAAGTTALTVDRTLGGMVNERDERGEKVYSPYFTTKAAKGVVEMQSLLAGITPGGMTAEEKKEQLVEGEVPIRQGRFWPLGNTPFQGGKVMYYRPSWYRKLQGGALFTSDTYGSPAEKFLFYNDISPLRPFDPYRFESKHYSDRPYPVSGEYFSGPWGPLTSVLNATVGKVLKPQVMMHEQEVMQGLGGYVPAGQFGAYNSAPYQGSSFGYGGAIGSGGAQSLSFTAPGIGGQASSQMIGAYNASYASAAGAPLATAANMTRNAIAGLNQPLMQMSYGPPKQRGVMAPPIVPTGQPLGQSSMQVQAGEIGYRMQEMMGIYGFGFSSLREKFGFGKGDFEPDRAVLQSASKAYGTSRAFWDLNLGGLGDVPLTAQGALGNLEFSEIVRRFIPKERTGIDYINPIRNTMGQQYPFLPGAEYYNDFTRGDPFTKISEGELRLPGVGYERFNRLYPDETGQYGLLNQIDILADVAPYSQQFKKLNRQADKAIVDPAQRIRLQEIRDQVGQTTKKYDFSPYEYQGVSAEDKGMHPYMFKAAKVGEYLAHRDTLFNTKFMQKRTAVEDWERRNVYGATFPEWQRPFESFIEPMINRATQRDPITAAASLGFAGSMFGRTPKAKMFGSLLGTLTGATASTLGNTFETISGERYIPRERRKELALEEYADILTYTKNTRLASMAQQAGDRGAAFQYRQAAQRTMYGADIYGASVDTLSLAVPKRKREHFKEMLNAPVEDRKRILSTAGRLERRIYQAAWGMQVEERPDLAEYFERHELPDASWEGWHPNTNMEHVKIKIGQNMGLEMSQMGYYPQQIKEATLTNPSYPDFFGSQNKEDTLTRLRQIMNGYGVSGTVTPVMNPFGSNNIDISAGIR